MKIISIASARPNFVKLAAVHHALKDKPGVEHIIIHTGQHYDPMFSDVFFQQLEIAEPKYHLNVRGGLPMDVADATAKELTPILEREKPNFVLVYGDVSGAVGGMLAAQNLKIPIGHIEAGLRSFDEEMPEESNRIRIDESSNYFFCTEKSALDNLEKEHIIEGQFGVKKIELVGNTMIDTLVRMMPEIQKIPLPPRTAEKFAIVTLHRPSNVDTRDALLKNIHFLHEVAKKIPLVLPLHHRLKIGISKLLSTEEQEMIFDQIKFNIYALEPLDYMLFIKFVIESKFILTDSGGIQEEAVFLKKRCFTLRKNTERPSTLIENGGTNSLIDIDKPEDRQMVLDYAANPMPIDVTIPPMWDGSAGENIARILLSA